jgi:hypothetical protein
MGMDITTKDITIKDTTTVSRRKATIRAEQGRTTAHWSPLSEAARPIAKGVENASISWLVAKASHAASTSGQQVT